MTDNVQPIILNVEDEICYYIKSTFIMASL